MNEPKQTYTDTLGSNLAAVGKVHELFKEHWEECLHFTGKRHRSPHRMQDLKGTLSLKHSPQRARLFATVQTALVFPLGAM